MKERIVVNNETYIISSTQNSRYKVDRVKGYISRPLVNGFIEDTQRIASNISYDKAKELVQWRV